ncbi:hypothetical protein SLS56_009713 [Neofusicoccum ribis]|uniref:Heterokaryon incompatibility domain-containing protein n=1 Tax=Neofusicoccum ribis TaxID=45134 RepID=A0ABR3SGI8_9PEZI
MKQGIRDADLPVVLRDAIYVARKLDLQYIWIDALCIIQDDKTDWEIEASKMASYYEGAHVTIAAAACEDTTVPFLAVRDPRWNPSKLNLSSTETVKVERYDEYELKEGKNQDFISSRGWIFQETALSMRIIHFRKSGIMWECRSGITYEPETYITSILPCPSAGNFPFPKSICSWFGTSTNRLKSWRSIINLYTSRCLSFPSDKLPAIGGVARVIQRSTGATYLCGLWRETLAGDLLWSKRRKIPSEEFSPPLSKGDWTPTWSWASLTGPVEYLEAGHSQNSAYPKFQLLESECVPLGRDPFGQVKGGFLRLRSNMLVARLKSTSTDGMPEYNLFPLSPKDSRQSRCKFVSDTALEEYECKTAVFPGCKTVRRRPLETWCNPISRIDACVELLLIAQYDYSLLPMDPGMDSKHYYLVLGRSEVVHGAHVRLGVVEFMQQKDLLPFQNDSMIESAVVHII